MADWLIAEAIPPATARYPPILTRRLGNEMGAVAITQPTAVNAKPIFLNFLKNLGVGSCSL